MAHAVLTISMGSIYDDLPEVQYHFPKSYLNPVRAALGDWIVYYEPRRSLGGGRQAYVAMARITGIEADPGLRDHFYARMADYTPFFQAVGFRNETRYWEPGLQKPDGSTSKGAFGRAVRPLSREAFEAIVCAGFQHRLDPWEIRDRALAEGVAEEIIPYEARPRAEQCLSRPFRDEAFRRQVREAYRNTCAFSGLHFLNGGGRPEVQAAHIRPVASEGPDSVRNGLALTGTLHWLFDRGLLSVGLNQDILVSSQGLPDDLGRLLRQDRRLTLPEHPGLHPHPAFLAWHREHVFKG